MMPRAAAGRLRALFMLVTAMLLVGNLLPAASADPLPVPTPDDYGCIKPVITTATPAGVTSCGGVRPGAFVGIPSQNAGCTLGFVYHDKYKRWHITTAGHCVIGEGKQKVWAEGKGPVVTDSAGRPFGRFVFASQKGDNDIGLILISKGVKPKASMCHFGGPTGLNTSRTSSAVMMEHYGNSVGIGDAVPARSGVALGTPEPKMVFAMMPSFLGDSGGPVLAASDGKAIGYVTAIGVAVGISGGIPYGGPIFIHRLGPQMSLAQKAIGYKLTLRTAKHSASML